MITLDGETLVLERTEGADDILPLHRPGKGNRPGAWYIDLGIEDQQVLNFLIDAEILAEPFPIRYIARTGQVLTAEAEIEELIVGPEHDRCRLHGLGPVPRIILADAPKQV